ncbi:MAG: NUDIX hydrolase [Barrevirus sp.]|uniref:NUDIX hydrolase n=1 Tax=Barrevirus sp. TaxID=2487763 RepID=A0A3G4ZPY8_9VIRU|nr:MAG: NUDIX hydrolase [Barrevirus sp.]
MDLPIAPCSGIIVIDLETEETILVLTDYDNYSFPKGKRNKGETSLETGLRKLTEETGLTQEDIQIIDNITIDEKSDRGGLATRYHIAYLIKNKKQITFDINELKDCRWIKITDAYNLEKFKDRRKDVLRETVKHITSYCQIGQ